VTDRTLELTRRLHALARTGLHFCANEYDRERYGEIERIAVELIAGPRPADQAALADLWRGEQGYVTPKVEVRGAVFRDGQVLLVREAVDGRWTLPGGWADVGDTPSTAAVRETLEESGYRVHATKLLALLDKTRHEHPQSVDYTYKVLVGCRFEGGDPVTSHEVDAVGFFARTATPELDLDRTTPGQIAMAWAHHDDPARPTDFD
jgi:ADP-ribose pyrophosphatase YjhB (NUDIX family)